MATARRSSSGSFSKTPAEFRESVINDAKTKVEDLLGLKVHYDREGLIFLTKRGIIPANFHELDYVERIEEDAINVGSLLLLP